jgi:hypothetical protein
MSQSGKEVYSKDTLLVLDLRAVFIGHAHNKSVTCQVLEHF